MEGIRLVRVRTKDAFPCFCVRFSLFLQSSPLWQCHPSRLSVISRLEREKAVRLRRTADRLTESSDRLTEFTGRLTVSSSRPAGEKGPRPWRPRRPARCPGRGGGVAFSIVRGGSSGFFRYIRPVNPFRLCETGVSVLRRFAPAPKPNNDESFDCRSRLDVGLSCRCPCCPWRRPATP